MPTLGICYGMQLMAQHLGGEVESNDVSEYGKTEVAAGESVLFRDLPAEQVVWMSHSDSVVAPPPGRTSPPARRRPRSPGSRTPLAGCTRCSSTPRWCTRRTGRRS